ncbi:MAG TPA: hypothetical protein VF796_08290 [Humisphaera sp.]
MRPTRLALVLAATAGLAAGAFAAPAAPQAPAADAPFQYWKDAPDQANVLAATFIGGKGNEWLVAGGFQPDGTVVLVGNVAGPVLELPVPVGVIGTDAAPPPEAKPVPQTEKAKNEVRQKTDKAGKPLWEKPSWRHPGVTAFVVRCTPDLKRVVSATRLPWAAGAATSAAVGPDGSVYVAGRATDGIAGLGAPAQELPAPPAADGKTGRCDHAFVAKLSPDGTKAAWVRHSKGPSDAPQVSVAADGTVRFTAQDVKTLDAGGKPVAAVTVPGGPRQTASVSPVDGTIVAAGEHHWATGREPWRCPILNTHNHDGTLRHQLYDWGGPYVGLDNLRLVSDTAVRQVTHDKDGNILLYAWSDGGNSPAAFQPTDVRTGVGHKGLGISAAGAGVLSAAYLIRIEPKDYKVTAWTLWLGIRAANKPNSVWIDNMAVAADGTVLVAGRAAQGLWQTRNKLSDCPNSGDYVAVLRKDLDAVRFCSFLPGTAATEASYDKASWGIATGTVNGKPRALFLGGATGESETDGVKYATPTVNAAQPKFAGGWSDGYVVMLDLSQPAPPATAQQAPAPVPGAPTSASFERSAQPKGKKAADAPADGTTFAFRPDVPKWVTADVEFRDRAGKMWPSFAYGKPVEGSATVKGGHLQAAFSVACPNATQDKGDQSRRVLGELYQGSQPPVVKFTLKSLSAPKVMEIEGTDNKGKPQKRQVEYCDGVGVLEVGGRAINVTPRVTVAYGKTQGVYKSSGKYSDPADSVRLAAYVTLKAADLGLKALPPATEVDVRVGMSGLSPEPSKK